MVQSPQLVASSTGARKVCFLGSCIAALACTAPQSKVGSIGAVLKRDTTTGVVIAYEVPEGLTADSAGLRPGDRVKMIDGVHVDDLDGARVVRLLRGPVGTRVTLTVIRGEEVLHLSVIRQGPQPRVAPLPKEERLE
jgi:carboxyl-terminal processing protease